MKKEIIGLLLVSITALSMLYALQLADQQLVEEDINFDRKYILYDIEDTRLTIFNNHNFSIYLAQINDSTRSESMHTVIAANYFKAINIGTGWEQTITLTFKCAETTRNITLTIDRY